jgi:hypothetical protein
MVSEDDGEKSTPDSTEEKLDQLLKEAEEKGKEIAKIGRELTEAGQTIADLADATRNVVKIVNNPPNSEFLISDWELTSYQAGVVLQQTSEIDVPSLNTTTGTTASTSADSFSYDNLYSLVPRPQQPRLAKALDQFNQISYRIADAGEVSSLMKLLGLDVAPHGRKSALDQFQIAHTAFASPVTDSNPVITSLIPMRESVRATIDNLLRRRPRQEKTRNEWSKIVSIGHQLKKDSLPGKIVNSWAAQWTNALQTYLSPSKEVDISRDEWRNRLTRSTLFLRGFLGGIDLSKMKN